jgi:hypothetical protein
MQKDITAKKLFSGNSLLAHFRCIPCHACIGRISVRIHHYYTSGIYFQHVNQRLNRNAATNIAAHSSPFRNGKTNDTSMAEIFHDVMSVNPGLEVYLLDTNGNILSFYAPAKKIALNKVSLRPLREFINNQGKQFVKGDDPRHPGLQKVFRRHQL